MSLNYYLGDIKNFNDVCYIEDGTDDAGKKLYRVGPETEGIIFACIAVGMEGITKKNCDEFCKRLYILQQVCGNYMRSTDEKTGEITHYPLERSHVEKHMGLSVNVQRMSKAQFGKKIMLMLESEYYRLERAKKAKDVKDSA